MDSVGDDDVATTEREATDLHVIRKTFLTFEAHGKINVSVEGSIEFDIGRNCTGKRLGLVQRHRAADDASVVSRIRNILDFLQHPVYIIN